MQSFLSLFLQYNFSFAITLVRPLSGINCESPDTFTGKHQEPWVNTGGLVAEIKVRLQFGVRCQR